MKPYDASGIVALVREDGDDEFWTPACSICGWIGEEVPADSGEYFNQSGSHFHQDA